MAIAKEEERTEREGERATKKKGTKRSEGERKRSTYESYLLVSVQQLSSIHLISQ